MVICDNRGLLKRGFAETGLGKYRSMWERGFAGETIKNEALRKGALEKGGIGQLAMADIALPHTDTALVRTDSAVPHPADSAVPEPEDGPADEDGEHLVLVEGAREQHQVWRALAGSDHVISTRHVTGVARSISTSAGHVTGTSITIR